MNADKKQVLILSLIGVIPVIWLALIVTPAIDGSIIESLPAIEERLQSPWQMQFDKSSVKTVQTTKGHAVVVTDDAERKQLRDQFKKRKNIRIVETQPVSKAYSIVSRDDASKPVRRGYWKMQEHIDGSVTWKCSRCKAVFYNREAFCPKCHSENRKVSHDPAWIDEIEGFDAFMD